VLELLDLVGSRLCRDRDRRSRVEATEGRELWLRTVDCCLRGVVVIISEAKDVFEA